MLLTLRGTPYIYQGDELGMTNYPFKSIDQFNDIEARNGYKLDVQTRHITTTADYLANLRHTSRDNARTPMQWDDSANGGFTTATNAWLAVNPNYKQINAAQETADPDSVYNYTRRMIALRAKTPAFVYGDYKDLDPQHPQIFVYTRILGPERYLVVHNFSARPIAYTLPKGETAGTLTNRQLQRRRSQCQHPSPEGLGVAHLQTVSKKIAAPGISPKAAPFK